jgi:selenocysteine-specific elongation factor
MEGGTEGLIQVKTKTPVVAGPGDHFLLRTSSPVRTIGGGLIVEAVPQRLKGSRPAVYEDLQERAEALPDERRFVEYCVRRAESLAVGEPPLAVRTKVPARRLQEILSDLVRRQTILSLGAGLYFHRDTEKEAEQRFLEFVGGFHRQAPESPGPPAEQLRQSMPIDKAVLDGLIARLKSDGRLVEKNQRLALPEHRSTFRDEDGRLLDTMEALFREKGFCPPSLEEVARQTGVAPDKVKKMLDILCQHERLVQVEPGFLFHREAVDRARDILIAHLRKEGRLESVQFKYLLDTTRKFALPILDYLDRTGVTRRVGNTRYPRDLPSAEG